jgi:hypothetical protein
MIDPCRDWRGVLGAAALGGIDPTEEIGLRAHLDGCGSCREELRELTAVARALAAVPIEAVVAAPAEPSGALATRVLERLSEERDEVRRRRRRRVLVGAGSFATAAAAVIVAVVLVLGGGGGPTGTHVALAGKGDKPAASAEATLHAEAIGTQVDVKVTGLDPGDYYWLWVTGADGHRIPAGTFQGSYSRESLHLHAALPLSEARRIWVTDKNDQIVLDARLPADA